MQALRRFVQVNERASAWLSLQASRTLGRRCLGFHRHVLAGLIRPQMRILDVGGGKRPAIDPSTKADLNLFVAGLDISASELAQAPRGSYDMTIVGDVATVAIPLSFDLIVSYTVLEHVRDTAAAMANMSSALLPGGVMAHYVPCANAPFALLNRLLGNRLSRKILWTIYPSTRAVAGYPAFYNNCTPRRMRRLCKQSGLRVAEMIPHFNSNYARFLAPLHAIDLSRQLILMRLKAENFAEAFTIVATKPAQHAPLVPYASPAAQPMGRQLLAGAKAGHSTGHESDHRAVPAPPPERSKR